jgi:hypothetical protein
LFDRTMLSAGECRDDRRHVRQSERAVTNDLQRTTWRPIAAALSLASVAD